MYEKYVRSKSESVIRIRNFFGANIGLSDSVRKLCFADSTEGNIWQTYQHCLIPKLFINAIASLPEKTEPAECSLITSGGN